MMKSKRLLLDFVARQAAQVMMVAHSLLEELVATSLSDESINSVREIKTELNNLRIKSIEEVRQNHDEQEYVVLYREGLPKIYALVEELYERVETLMSFIPAPKLEGIQALLMALTQIRKNVLTQLDNLHNVTDIA